MNSSFFTIFPEPAGTWGDGIETKVDEELRRSVITKLACEIQWWPGNVFTAHPEIVISDELFKVLQKATDKTLVTDKVDITLDPEGVFEADADKLLANTKFHWLKVIDAKPGVDPVAVYGDKLIVSEEVKNLIAPLLGKSEITGWNGGPEDTQQIARAKEWLIQRTASRANQSNPKTILIRILTVVLLVGSVIGLLALPFVLAMWRRQDKQK
jgi:hypothetical protein